MKVCRESLAQKIALKYGEAPLAESIVHSMQHPRWEYLYKLVQTYTHTMKTIKLLVASSPKTPTFKAKETKI